MVPNSHLQIPLPDGLSEHLRGELRAKLAFVDQRISGATLDRENSTIHVEFSQALGDREISGIKDKVDQVLAAMVDHEFEPEIRILEDHSRTKFSCTQDPMPGLVAGRDVLPEGKGVFAFGPLLARLVDRFEDKMKSIAGDFGAAPYRFPSLISPGYLERVKYFSNFPHSLCFVTHLREDLEVIKNFATDGHAEDGCVVAPDGSYAQAQAMLSPTVCHHLYMMLADSTLPEDGLAATAFGNCFRYESINMVSLERLWNFTMREIIFVGGADYVIDRLEAAKSKMNEVLAEIDLAYRIETATDPFFVGNYRDLAAYQTAFELKHEVRAQLPYSGDSLAIGSYNRHQDFFGRTLDIRLPDGNFAHTGCVGFGFERTVFAFIAQHGSDPENWPAGMKDAIA